jgi:hypothetical protein
MNGKHHDNPLSDMTIHGEHRVPLGIEALLRRVDELGRAVGRWPLGENWPFATREFDWAEGRELDAAEHDLRRLIALLEQGRGDEILVDPLTQKPFAEPGP